MQRICFLILSFLFFSTPVFGQSSATDSQTLKDLLTEVRLLRRELHITTVAAQRAQVLTYRAQVQEFVVQGLQARVKNARSSLVEIRSEQESRAESIKQIEQMKDQAETPTAEQKRLEESLTQIKGRFEANSSREQEAQAELTDAEDQLKIEQAKLESLQEQMDRLEKSLDNVGVAVEGYDHD